jgi:hypothetical protein
MEATFDVEIKKLNLQRDIFALQGAEMEQRKIILESKKRLYEAEAKLKEYQTKASDKHTELEQLS